MTIAVPVSWHIGSTPPAEMLAFFRSSSATYLSFGEASASSRMVRELREMARPQQMGDVLEGLGGEQGQRLRARPSARRWPLNVVVPTKSEVSLR